MAKIKKIEIGVDSGLIPYFKNMVLIVDELFTQIKCVVEMQEVMFGKIKELEGKIDVEISKTT